MNLPDIQSIVFTLSTLKLILADFGTFYRIFDALVTCLNQRNSIMYCVFRGQEEAKSAISRIKIFSSWRPCICSNDHDLNIFWALHTAVRGS